MLKFSHWENVLRWVPASHGVGRRRWGGGGASHAVAALESLEDRCLLSADMWTQRGGDAGHSSYVETNLDPSDMEEAWFQAVGYPQSGTGGWNERAVATDGERVYRTALEGYAPVGTYHVIAYDLKTGEEVWHRTFLGGAFDGVGEPSISGGIIYINRAGHSQISGGTADDLPRIYGLDAETGVTVLERTYDAQWASNERPVIADDQLVVKDGYYGGMSAFTASTLTKEWHVALSGSTSVPFASIDDEYIYAFGNEVYHREDGTRLANIVHPSLSGIGGAMVSDSGRLIFSVNGYVDGAYQFGIAAFDGDTHQLLWTTLTEQSTNAKAVGNGLVVVASGTQLHILDETDGSIIRSWQAPSGLSSEIVLTKDHVFVQSLFSGSLARIHAINLSTGDEVWRWEHRASTGYASMEMAFGGGHLLLSHHQFVRAFRVNERQEIHIDVLPDDPANQVSLQSKYIQVAVIATEDFDPLGQIDLASLRLRATGSETGAVVDSHKKHGYKYELRDVNGDGLWDLVLNFKTSEVGLKEGDLLVTLEGDLLAEFGGDHFSVEQEISVNNKNGKGNGKRKK